MYRMHKIENKRLWKDELTAHNWQKMKKSKTTVGYSDMRYARRGACFPAV